MSVFNKAFHVKQNNADQKKVKLSPIAVELIDNSRKVYRWSMLCRFFQKHHPEVFENDNIPDASSLLITKLEYLERPFYVEHRQTFTDMFLPFLENMSKKLNGRDFAEVALTESKLESNLYWHTVFFQLARINGDNCQTLTKTCQDGTEWIQGLDSVLFALESVSLQLKHNSVPDTPSKNASNVLWQHLQQFPSFENSSQQVINWNLVLNNFTQYFQTKLLEKQTDFGNAFDILQTFFDPLSSSKIGNGDIWFLMPIRYRLILSKEKSTMQLTKYGEEFNRSRQVVLHYLSLIKLFFHLSEYLRLTLELGLFYSWNNSYKTPITSDLFLPQLDPLLVKDGFFVLKKDGQSFSAFSGEENGAIKRVDSVSQSLLPILARLANLIVHSPNLIEDEKVAKNVSDSFWKDLETNVRSTKTLFPTNGQTLVHRMFLSGLSQSDSTMVYPTDFKFSLEDANFPQLFDSPAVLLCRQAQELTRFGEEQLVFWSKKVWELLKTAMEPRKMDELFPQLRMPEVTDYPNVGESWLSWFSHRASDQDQLALDQDAFSRRLFANLNISAEEKRKAMYLLFKYVLLKRDDLVSDFFEQIGISSAKMDAIDNFSRDVLQMFYVFSCCFPEIMVVGDREFCNMENMRSWNRFKQIYLVSAMDKFAKIQVWKLELEKKKVEIECGSKRLEPPPLLESMEVVRICPKSPPMTKFGPEKCLEPPIEKVTLEKPAKEIVKKAPVVKPSPKSVKRPESPQKKVRRLEKSDSVENAGKAMESLNMNDGNSPFEDWKFVNFKKLNATAYPENLDEKYRVGKDEYVFVATHQDQFPQTVALLKEKDLSKITKDRLVGLDSISMKAFVHYLVVFKKKKNMDLVHHILSTL